MNEKINNWNVRISTLMPKKGRGGHNRKDCLVSLTAYTEGQGAEAPKRDIMRVSLSSRILELTGWRLHDVIDAEIQDGMMTCFRSDSGSKICKCSGGTRYYIRYSLPLGFTTGFPTGECTEVETKPSRIAFCLPE